METHKKLLQKKLNKKHVNIAKCVKMGKYNKKVLIIIALKILIKIKPQQRWNKI